MKSLGIYYATACYRDEQGRYYTSGGLGRYLQVMNARYPFEVVLAAPVTTQPLAHLRYPLPMERTRVYELPYFETFLGAVKVRRFLVHALKSFLHQEPVDVLWLRYPGAYSTVLWREAKRHGVPVFYQLVGDPVSLLSGSSRMPAWRKAIAVAVARWHENSLRHELEGTPVFAISSALARRLAQSGAEVPVIPASSLLQGDFFWREDTCLSTPVRVLFVGALRHEKSVDTLIEAVRLLQAGGYSVHLDVVGDGSEREALEQQASRSLAQGSFRFHGFVTDPELLHQQYVRADIFVLCSVSEGLGRVILESMARGVPVVATHVGGIPDLIRDGENGMLVPPRNPHALAQAMERLLNDSSLRRRLIADGYHTAASHTTERFLDEVVRFVREQVGVDLVAESASVQR